MELYQNPIQKRGDFADPFVLRYNGTYYLYCTNPDVRCWSSCDLLHWQPEGASVPPEEFPGLVPFAPEVVYWNGAFYMYTSPHGFGHYVLKSSSPTGPFRKITGNIGHAIDFSVFIDDDGQWYAYWADDKGILGCKMDSPTEFGEPTYIGAYLHGWTEGPFVVKREGKYHLTYTGNHFLSRGYRIHAAIADSPLGSYRDDPLNPVIVQTEGEVVGLGHSSTVLGPDLHTCYIVYHNLNPDKSRDLNIDPVVFTQEKAYVLGPTAAPRPAPARPQWQCRRSEFQLVNRAFAEEVRLPPDGAAELNLAAGDKTNRYGVRLGETIQIEFDKARNSLSVMDAGGLIAGRKLIANYDHEVLHCIRVEYGLSLTVWVDHLLQLRADRFVGGGGISYYCDDALYIGTATVHSDAADLHYPVPCVAPGDRRICFDIAADGEYQIAAMGCSEAACGLCVDGIRLAPEQIDDAGKLAIYRCSLPAGDHVLSTAGGNAGMLAIVPRFADHRESLRADHIGPFDKIHGLQQSSDVRIHANFQIADRGENWQAGVLLRAGQFADGGEGNDKELGTNFFIGYRVCVSDGKIQLWKHRYDEALLQEAAFEAADSADFDVSAVGNCITVCAGGRPVLSYRDPIPILQGYSGFHARNCVIIEGMIT